MFKCPGDAQHSSESRVSLISPVMLNGKVGLEILEQQLSF